MMIQPSVEARAPGGPSSIVVVIGLMGAGKSSLAEALAARLGWPHRDSDADIEALLGLSGAELTDRDGVDELHAREEEVLLSALEAPGPLVVSAAGWVVESSRCRRRLRERAIVVWIDLPVDVLLERMKQGTHRRPMTSREATDLARRRDPLFREVANLRLDGRDPTSELVESVLDLLANPSPERGISID